MGREIWVDNVKVIACILVVLGHFFSSLVSAEIMTDSLAFQWFIQTIYTFHVPLFFICSGYLYQRHTQINRATAWGKNISKKLLDLGVPYLVFSTITWAFKTLFSSSVNSPMELGLLTTLFLQPASPYWFLYILFFVFLVTPTIKDKRWLVAIITCALVLKGGGILGSSFIVDLPYVIAGMMQYEIWFVLGMVIGYFDVPALIAAHGKKLIILSALTLSAFIALSILPLTFTGNPLPPLAAFALGLLACVSITVLTCATFAKNQQPYLWKILAKYTFPIFLMHTLCAAPMRMLLLKLGVNDLIIHLIIGLVASFFGPIVIAMIMKKSKILTFLLYPRKTLNQKA
jgi:fucose 4-O-acetylase-like acetyltransferase